jgi:hypothetical protein
MALALSALGVKAAPAQQAYLKASNTEAGDYAAAAAVSGDTVVVGAIWEDSNAIGVNGNGNNNNGFDSGAAYVFVRSGTNWSQQAYLKASNTAAEDYFGYDVGVSGDTVVAVAPQEDSNATTVNGNPNNNTATDSGAAYVFTGLGIGPRLAIVADTGVGYRIRCSGVPDLTYRFERAPGVTGPWESIATSTAPASGLIEYHESTITPGGAFYRAVRP